MSGPTGGVFDLTGMLTLDVRARGFLQTLRAGDAIAQVLDGVMRTLDKDQQRALCMIVAWRLAGGNLPATESLTHFPMFAQMRFERIQAALTALYEGGVIAAIETEEGKPNTIGFKCKMGFAWPALERTLTHIVHGIGGNTVRLPSVTNEVDAANAARAQQEDEKPPEPPAAA